MAADDPERSLKGALAAVVASAGAGAGRGALWINVLSLPAACYTCSMPYGGGIVAGPLVALLGPVAGVLLGSIVGAVVGALRSHHPSLVVPVVMIATIVVGGPYGCYELDRRQDERRQELRRAAVQAPEGPTPIPGGADSGAE